MSLREHERRMEFYGKPGVSEIDWYVSAEGVDCTEKVVAFNRYEHYLRQNVEASMAAVATDPEHFEKLFRNFFATEDNVEDYEIVHRGGGEFMVCITATLH